MLTAADGTATTIVPDIVSEWSMDVTIPGTLAAGNYTLRAVKGSNSSNAIGITIVPEVVITDVKCRKRRGRLIIRGSGFNEKIEGSDSYINVEVNDEIADIISWNDNRIKVSVSSCSADARVKVNALFGTATSGPDKPPKPCNGKDCNN